MYKHRLVNILAISIIVSAMICTVSAGPDDRSVSQVELKTINAIQKAIDVEGSNWTAGKTSVSELTVEEKLRLCGARIGGPIPVDVQFARLPVRASVTYAESFDWRNKDGKDWMTPVKSQGSCGSCWAFSAIGVVEAAINIYANDPDIDIDLSEQHLVSDCCNAGSCGGGIPDGALKYVRDTGVPEESCFPYIASNCACTPCSDWAENPWGIENYVYVSSSTDAFKSALQEYGPLSVVLSVPDDWFYYVGGVYTPTWEVTNGVGWANHAVVLVGWNDSEGCWIIKNSWGSGWGEQGYARVLYGNLEKYDYAYAVTGIVHDGANQPPVVGASACPESGTAPLTVAFTGTGSDSDGTIISYEWTFGDEVSSPFVLYERTFGDGVSSTSQNPIHIYNSPGTYTATLTVTDDDGATGSDSVVITVTESANQPPVAGAFASPESGTAPLDVAFTGTGSDSDGTVVSYEWTFGDGTSSTSQNPAHIYNNPGTYTATLTVTDDDGATGSDSVVITVTESTVGDWVNPVDVIASSSLNKNRAPENAIDDNAKTYWCSSRDDSPPCWIQFNLGEIKTISKVRAIIYYKDVPMTLDVQVSNDAANWETVVSGATITEGGTFVELPFAQTDARYIRLHETGFARMYGQCTEFDVYAYT
jgi:PKD repeat protein